MALKSKKTLFQVVLGLGLGIGYLVYALSGAAPAVADIKGWAVAMLIVIAIGVGTMIVSEIIFHIVISAGVAIKEEMKGNKDKKDIDNKIRVANNCMEKEDEMDKSINLKANYVNSGFVGTGIFAALITLACGVTGMVAMHIVLGACVLGSIVDGVCKIFFYEKGIK